MPSVHVNGINIAYEQDGAADAPAVLAIMGVGEQLTHWPEEFYLSLVENGYQVIRFDNRDVGLSSQLGDQGPLDIMAVIMAKMTGSTYPVPYSVEDMAADSLGLLEALNIPKAHVVGVSLGGVIAQTMAIKHPERILSLTLISTTSDNPSLPRPNPTAMMKIMSKPESNERESWIQNKIDIESFIGNPGYPEQAEKLRQRAEEAYDRMHYPEGVTRQVGAGISAGSRVEALKKIDIPTLVIHGRDDNLFAVDAGEDLANHLPNATLAVIEGMGHGVSSPLMPIWVNLIATHLSETITGRIHRAELFTSS